MSATGILKGKVRDNKVLLNFKSENEKRWKSEIERLWKDWDKPIIRFTDVLRKIEANWKEEFFPMRPPTRDEKDRRIKELV